jgi:hypothetical protein
MSPSHTPGTPLPIAAVITEWRTNSHADVILGRLVEPARWGHAQPFRLRLASVYADQFPPNDLCRDKCRTYGIPLFSTIRDAVGVGRRSVPVDGVLIIGEHGDYAINARGQKFYPRRRLFEGVVQAFRELGRRVPVFSDKHLSYEWLFARWMYDLARHEEIPLMAGSSLPVAWRVPDLDLPMGCELTRAFALGYSDLDAYGFHALEMLQCMTERRIGGETGVAAVQCFSGKSIWEPPIANLWPRDLVEALLPARKKATPSAQPPRPIDQDTLFQIEYTDGLTASVAMLDTVGECFAFASERKGVSEPDAAVFDLENVHPFGHFGYLIRAIEHLIATGRPPYPVERTLLTTGVLAAVLESRAEGGLRIATPHLARIKYQPADWPHAIGATGTPA